MKHRKIYLTGLLSIASLMASAQNQVEQLPIYIDKLKPTEIPERAPRTPDYCSEISAYYQNGVIYLQFSEDIGCMNVEVVNLTTGELWSDDAGGTAVVNRTYTLNGTPFTSHKLTIVK